MQVNNLGGVRVPVSTTNSTSQTAGTRFSTLMQGGTAAPAAGRAAVPGASIISTAISANSGSIPGSTFGTPYLQAMPAGGSVPASGTQAAQSPATGTGSAGSEFNGELQAAFDQQKALRELMQMSLMSFVNGSFALGQSMGKMEMLGD